MIEAGILDCERGTPCELFRQLEVPLIVAAAVARRIPHQRPNDLVPELQWNGRNRCRRQSENDRFMLLIESMPRDGLIVDLADECRLSLDQGTVQMRNER